MQNTNIDVTKVSNMLTEVDMILCRKIESDCSLLIKLADDMAESATKFEGQGYKIFLESRNSFVSVLEDMSKEYKNLVCLLKR